MKLQKIWKKLEIRVNKKVDGLGRPIDRDIKSILVALWAHGFETSMSCSGHIDRALPYPWVNISPLGIKKRDRLIMFGRMQKLLDEFYDERDFDRDVKLISDLNPRYGSFRLESIGAKMVYSLPQELLTQRVRRGVLKRYRKEMNCFRVFLKEKFFAK